MKAVVPPLGLLVAGDIAYNNVHQYLADGGFNGGIDAWLRAIDMVRALQPAAVSPATRTQAAQTTHASSTRPPNTCTPRKK